MRSGLRRRLVVVAGALAGAGVIGAPARAQELVSSEVLALWPAGRVPGPPAVAPVRRIIERGSAAAHDRAVTHVAEPVLEVVRPARPNGAAVVLFPGGGYVRLAIDKEGAMGARSLAAEGVTAFVLEYRLPGDGWAAGYDAPLQDAQRAVRLVRAQARRFGVDPAKVGVMGFSAGGHLAASLLTRSDERLYHPVDGADAASARPDFVVLAYAPLRWRLPAGDPGAAWAEAASSAALARTPDQRVRPGLPPVFLVHAADDSTVSVEDSLRMFTALQHAGVRSELHVYENGGHGFGFALPADRPAASWFTAFLAWARQEGWAGAAPAR